MILQMLIVMVAGWVQRHQQQVISYLTRLWPFSMRWGKATP